MWTRLVGAAASSLLLLVGGCGTQPSADPSARSTISTPTSSMDSGGDNKAGTIPVATLSEIVGSYVGGVLGQSPTPIVAGSRLRLQVLDHTISLNAGCNTMAGRASVKDSHLVTDRLAVTEMACDTALMEQDAWLARRLAKSPRLDRSGPYLSLVWEDGWLGFALADDQVLPGASPSSPDKPVSASATTEPGPS